MIAKQVLWLQANTCDNNQVFYREPSILKPLSSPNQSGNCTRLSAEHTANGILKNRQYAYPGEQRSKGSKVWMATKSLASAPALENLISEIQKCRDERNLSTAKKVHQHARDHGLDTHKSVGNYLIPMLVDCGSVLDAEQVFQEMQGSGVQPNRHALHALLRGCAQLKLLERGQSLHGELAKEGLQSDSLIGCTLVAMYVKCGALAEAQDVFDELPVHDKFSWTALISGYSDYGYGEEALYCFNKMQLEGLSPDAVTFVCCLKACTTLKSEERGYRMHADIVKEGFEQNEFISGVLVDMYAKCGFLEEAKQVLEDYSLCDRKAWTSLMAGYADHGHAKEALACLKQMQLGGVDLDAFTSVCGLKACGMIGALHLARKIHHKIVKEEFEIDPFLGSILVDVYAKCGSLIEAEDVFMEMPSQAKNVVSWTALISAYFESGYSEEALACWEQMQVDGARPNAITFVCSLKSCGNIGAVEKAWELHATAFKEGFENDSSLLTTLVDTYAKCGLLQEAQNVFEELDFQDITAWNSLCAGYGRQGEIGHVFLFFEKMVEKGIQPSAVTLLNALTVCSHAGLTEKGKVFFKEMIKVFGLTPSLEHYNCMIDLFGRAGQRDITLGLFEGIPFHPDLVTWKSILTACQRWGDLVLGKQIFRHAWLLDGDQAGMFTLMSNIFGEPQVWEHMECEYCDLMEPNCPP